MNEEQFCNIMFEGEDFRFLSDESIPDENSLFDAILHMDEIEGLDEV